MIAPVETVPLRYEESGAIRMGQTRVLLELVLHAFDDGATPEEIVSAYSTLPLADVYSVIAWSLRHRGQARAYLKRREEQAEQVWQHVDRRQGDLSELRNRILSRRTQESSDAEAGRR